MPSACVSTVSGAIPTDRAMEHGQHLVLVREGRIELEEVLSSADSRTNLEAKINFG
jgi:hypothetical protein